MNYLVALGGLLMMASSVMAGLAPRKFVAAFTKLPPNLRFSLAFGIRLLLGVIFLLGAAQTALPTFVTIMGILALLAAVVVLLMGRARIDAMIQWWLRQSPAFMGAWALIGLILGALVLYAGLAMPPPVP